MHSILPTNVFLLPKCTFYYYSKVHSSYSKNIRVKLSFKLESKLLYTRCHTHVKFAQIKVYIHIIAKKNHTAECHGDQLQILHKIKSIYIS